jgi:ferritin-like metal-binding protein YciE
MNIKQVEELVLQSLEHELGGVKIYTTALTCALNADLKEEWQAYLEQTQTHVSALERVCGALGIDVHQETPGRQVVRHVGAALVEAMNLALKAGDPAAAELVACESVVLAETKDHADWQLLAKCAEHMEGAAAGALGQAHKLIEDQEDEHLYHTKGWCRELWLQSLGLPAVLPPPEERQHVKTAIGAARAEQMADKVRLDSERETP